MTSEAGRLATKQWRARNHAHILAYQRLWRAKNLPRLNEYDRLKHRESRARRFGVVYPIETKCEICERPISGSQICLDHNHITGLFRGWLCWACNRELGIFETRKEKFERYLLR